MRTMALRTAANTIQFLCVLSALFGLTTLPARAQTPAPAAKGKFAQRPIAIMAIGDSITAAPWFRRALKANFEKDGIPTDFVGTQFGANPEGGFTDGEHEGYPGYKIDGVEKLLRDPQKGALVRFRADVILVMLGTNDIGQGQLAGAQGRLEGIVKLLLRAQPNARIVLATIPPILPFAFSDYGKHGADVPKFNAGVVRLAEQYTGTRRVFMADLYSALPPAKEYIGDGVHPSGYGVAPVGDGYKRMGDAYYKAIQAALKAAPLRRTDTPSRSRLSLDGTWRFTPAGPQQGPETSPTEIARTLPGAVAVPGSWMDDRDWVARGSSSGGSSAPLLAPGLLYQRDGKDGRRGFGVFGCDYERAQQRHPTPDGPFHRRRRYAYRQTAQYGLVGLIC